MNFNLLSKSSKSDILVGDLGSSNKNESFYTLSIVGRGTKKSLREMVKQKIGSGKIVNESIKTLDDGRISYEARVRTENGI